jgi:hypothetical protein
LQPNWPRRLAGVTRSGVRRETPQTSRLRCALSWLARFDRRALASVGCASAPKTCPDTVPTLCQIPTLPLWLRPVCCPRAGCIAVLTASTAPASSFGGAAEKPHLTCPSCKASCCRVCLKAPHFPLPCDLAMDALHRLSVLRTLQRTLRPSVAQIVGVTQDMSDEDKGVIPRAELAAYSRVPCPRCGLVGTARPSTLHNFELPHETLVLHCAPCAASFCARCGDSAHSQFELFRGVVVCGRLTADFGLTHVHGPLMNANQAREARALHVQSAQYGRVKHWFQELKDLAAARLPADLAPFSESKLN